MEFHNQSEFIEVKSPIDRFKEEWAQMSGNKAFFRQRTFVLQSPDLVQYAELARAKGWIQPLRFALQALLLAAFFVSAFSWLCTHDGGKTEDEIAKVQAELDAQLKTAQANIDAPEFQMGRIQTSRKTSGFTVASSTNLTKDEAREQLNALMEEKRKQQEEDKRLAEIKMQNIRAKGAGRALAASGTPVVFSLALIFAAPVFGKIMRNSYSRQKLARQADSYYLYYVASRGLWLNCGVVVALNLFLSASGYGLGGLIEGVGVIGQTLFWLAFYGLVLYWFFDVSKDLHKAMQLPKLSDYAGLDNKVLLYMHNSFWITFVVFEAMLGLLSYGVFLLDRAS
jgi:hypothetical protein